MRPIDITKNLSYKISKAVDEDIGDVRGIYRAM